MTDPCGFSKFSQEPQSRTPVGLLRNCGSAPTSGLSQGRATSPHHAVDTQEPPVQENVRNAQSHLVLLKSKMRQKKAQRTPRSFASTEPLDFGSEMHMYNGANYISDEWKPPGASP